MAQHGLPDALVGVVGGGATVLPLVEIVQGLRTSSTAADTAEKLATSWGKTTVRYASTPGFLVSRKSART